MAKTKCASKIWAKFTIHEKSLWNVLYADYLEELTQQSRNNNEVIAHNLACNTIWKMQETDAL